LATVVVENASLDFTFIQTERLVLNYLNFQSRQVFWDAFLASTATAVNFKTQFNHKDWPTV